MPPGKGASESSWSARDLSADAPTALAEYQQVSPLLPPGTIVSYDVALQLVVDFTGGYVPGEPPVGSPGPWGQTALLAVRANCLHRR